MKKLLNAIFVTIFLGLGTYVYAINYVRGETMSLSRVEKKWGKKEFKADLFKQASEADRAAMAASLVKNKKQFIGKDRSEVRSLLGDYSGHYISGLFPTYMIQDAVKIGDEAWQIVFLLDANEKVRNIVVHKNCCYN
jgi:hypothetical protein